MVGIESTVPTQKEAVTLLAPIMDKWYQLGIALVVKNAVLNSLITSHYSTEVKLCMTIERWLQEQSKGATWNMLLLALENPIVDCRDTAENIRDFLKRPDVIAKYVNQ